MKNNVQKTNAISDCLMYNSLNNHQRRGVSAVETALMLPLLVIVTFGAIDVAQFVSSGQVVANASREGARVASRVETQTVDEVEAAVEDYLIDAMPHMTRADVAAAISIQVRKVTGHTPVSADVDDTEGTSPSGPGQNNYSTIPAGNLTSVGSGNSLSVEIQFDFEAIRWLSGPQYGVQTSETVCRRE